MTSTSDKTPSQNVPSDPLAIESVTSDPNAVKLPGAASLYEQLDKLVLVRLRDGRNFYGWLRSFDQYANLTLDNTVERLVQDDMYADVPVGIFVIRGENVMLLGEVDEQRELEVSATLKAVPEKQLRDQIDIRKREDADVKLSEKVDRSIAEEY